MSSGMRRHLDENAHLLGANLRYRSTANNGLSELGEHESSRREGKGLAPTRSPISPRETTHPTILSHVLLTYFFCSTPSLTTSTTVLTSLVKSAT